MSHIVEYVLLAVAIAVVIAFIVLTWQRLKDWLSYINTPEKTVHAKIIDKSTDTTYGSYPGRIDGSSLAVRPCYIISFQTDDGEELEFSVPEKEWWEQLKTGDEGMLTYQKDVYKKFEKD